MLRIIVLGEEFFDESKQEFVTKGDTIIDLEHSLLSVSKWESKYEKPFLGKEEKTTKEALGYVEAMTLTPNIAPEVFSKLSSSNHEEINAYVNAKMTATWFREIPGPLSSPEVITSELIYYWLTVFNIPFTCETWHLNRLLTLIRICSIKGAKPKKMSRSELAARQRTLNDQRRAQYGTTG